LLQESWLLNQLNHSSLQQIQNSLARAVVKAPNSSLPYLNTMICTEWQGIDINVYLMLIETKL